jgi:hypothetical protein
MKNTIITTPFGPRIYRSTFDASVLDMLTTVATEYRNNIDTMLTNGTVNGSFISLPNKTNFDIFYQELKKHVINYIELSKNAQIDYKTFSMDLVTTESMWVNFQRANDFVFLHTHETTKISAVIYLKIPQALQEESKQWDKKCPATPGMIEFVYGTKNDFCPGTYSFLPEESEIVLFPSYLLHHVYPFKSAGERWSINTNITNLNFQTVRL